MRSCYWALTPCRFLQLKRVSWSIKVTKLLCYSYCLLVWSCHDKNSTKCQDCKQVHQASKSEPMVPMSKYSRSNSFASKPNSLTGEGKGLCSPSCKVVSLMWLPLALLAGLRCLLVMAASCKLNKFCPELLLSSYRTGKFFGTNLLLTDWLIDWLIDRLIDWLLHWWPQKKILSAWPGNRSNEWSHKMHVPESERHLFTAPGLCLGRSELIILTTCIMYTYQRINNQHVSWLKMRLKFGVCLSPSQLSYRQDGKAFGITRFKT